MHIGFGLIGLLQVYNWSYKATAIGMKKNILYPKASCESLSSQRSSRLVQTASKALFRDMTYFQWQNKVSPTPQNPTTGKFFQVILSNSNQ
jgi:hypothetical protein